MTEPSGAVGTAKSISEALKAVPDLAKQIYTDSASGVLQELGKIGVDVVKTFRLALAPIQFAAAFQDRLAGYIDEAVRKVPVTRRASPPQSLALSVCDRLKFCDPAELVALLYVELLARSMDSERIGEAHPAFVHVISQLARDEILMIRQLGTPLKNRSAPGKFRIYVSTGGGRILTKELSEQVLRTSARVTTSTAEAHTDMLMSICVEPEELAQPELFGTLLEHLVSLGIVSYTNKPMSVPPLAATRNTYEGIEWFCIELSSFGRLFFEACVRDIPAQPSNE